MTLCYSTVSKRYKQISFLCIHFLWISTIIVKSLIMGTKKFEDVIEVNMALTSENSWTRLYHLLLAPHTKNYTLIFTTT